MKDQLTIADVSNQLLSGGYLRKCAELSSPVFDVLSQADRLVDEGRYSQALSLLVLVTAAIRASINDVDDLLGALQLISAAQDFVTRLQLTDIISGAVNA